MRNINAKVSDPKVFVTCAGDRYHTIYSPKVLENGTIELVETGKDDIQEYIDSQREQTDIHYIMQRLQLGDTSVLTNREPMYGDFTKFPKTQAEILQLMIDAKHEFEHLPLDVRNKFDGDFNKWFVSLGNAPDVIKEDIVEDPIPKEDSKED